MALRKSHALIVVLLGLSGCTCSAVRTSEANRRCEGRGTSVVAELSRHRLLLCEDELASAQYRIAIGRGGTGKTREGDLKTPLGVYPLGPPRASSKYHTFIPIGYPTAAQRLDGYTGSAIGIHGPSRSFSWAKSANTFADWTRGCIAVASDDAIAEIASWVRKKNPSRVYLEND